VGAVAAAGASRAAQKDNSQKDRRAYGGKDEKIGRIHGTTLL